MMGSKLQKLKTITLYALKIHVILADFKIMEQKVLGFFHKHNMLLAKTLTKLIFL